MTLVRLGNGDAYVDPDMVALVTPREDGGVRIFMKAEGGGAVLNFTEGTPDETYAILSGLDPYPYLQSGAPSRRYRVREQGTDLFAPRTPYSQDEEDYL